MSGYHRKSVPRSIIRLACAILGCVTTVSFADAPFLLDARAVDSGSAVTIGNSCSRLSASIGQAVAGFSSGGGFDLAMGFQSVAATGSDTLFFDGFEGCTP